VSLEPPKKPEHPGEFLRAEDLYKAYKSPTGPQPVLEGVSLSLERGESISLTGPSGSGKSTLLQCLGLLSSPDRGRIFLEGKLVDFSKTSRLEAIRGQYVGFVFQKHLLLPELSLLENVALPLARTRGWTREVFDRAESALERMGVSHRKEARPFHLSGGEAQRGAIARALVVEPPILMMDEPTGNLDPGLSRDLFGQLLETCKGLRMSLLVVTHNLELAGQTGRNLRLDHHHLEVVRG